MSERNESILLVDDEENVLSSLRRLFRPDGYAVFAATSAEDGMALLQENTIWLVISDNAMPGTTGLRFLENVRERWPDIIRIMLTGNADLDAAIEAINSGEVYRFVTKPWDPEGLRYVVKQGLEQYWLIQENSRMKTLIEKQNDLLKKWNQSLHLKVEESTEELKRKSAELELLSQQARVVIPAAVKVFNDIFELRDPSISEHARRVAALSRTIAEQLALDEDTVRSIEIAALFHDVGKMGLPDHVLRKNESIMTPVEKAMLYQHPVLGQAALNIIDGLDSIGLMVRHHHERWDGLGYPDGLNEEKIPIGSRVIAVADGFDRFPEVSRRQLSDFFRINQYDRTNHRFDPSVVTALKIVFENAGRKTGMQEIGMEVKDLREGMILSRDIRSTTGILLATQGEVLKEVLIEKLFSHEKQKFLAPRIYVYGE